MKTVHKFEVRLGLAKNFQDELNEWSLKVPEGSEILALDTQFGMPIMHILVNTEKPEVERVFRVFATGERMGAAPYGKKWKYVGTVSLERGGWKYHVFESIHVE